jgi:hypothetical protein
MAASLRAFAAMIHIVFFAFGGTGVTDVGADLAERVCVVAPEAHELRGCAADSSAFHVEFYALRHFLHHSLFAKAGGSTVVTDGRALQAGIDAGLITGIHATSFLSLDVW